MGAECARCGRDVIDVCEVCALREDLALQKAITVRWAQEAARVQRDYDDLMRASIELRDGAA